MSAGTVPSNTTERIRRHLVGLKMPRALWSCPRIPGHGLCAM